MVEPSSSLLQDVFNHMPIPLRERNVTSFTMYFVNSARDPASIPVFEGEQGFGAWGSRKKFSNVEWEVAKGGSESMRGECFNGA